MEDRNLIVQTAFLGDVLLSIPLISNVKKLFPETPLVLYCRKGYGQFFESLNLVDEIIEADKTSFSSRRKAFNRLSGYKYNYLFCPHRSPRSFFLVKRLKAKVKIGFKQWWNSYVFDRRVVRDPRLPDAIRQLSLLSGINTEFDQNLQRFKENLETWMIVPEWASMHVKSRQDVNYQNKALSDLIGDFGKGLVFLAPGSVWATKRWTFEGFVEVAKDLVAKGLRVVLIGAPDEVGICKKMANEVEGLVDLSGLTSVSDLFLLLSRGKLLVANDSGAMHLGACAGIPTIAIFGPTTLELGYRPWQNKAVVLQKDLECRPCGKHGHKKCPIGTHECMKMITAKDVLEKIDSIIS